MRCRVHRVVASALLPILVGQMGCAGGTQRLEREDLLDPPEASSYRVTTVDGRSLTFIALHLEEDDLVGTIRVTSSETVGEGETQRTNVTNRYEEARLPWPEVSSVEAEGADHGPPAVLLAGGAIALGAAAFLLLSSGSDAPSTGDGGKGF